MHFSIVASLAFALTVSVVEAIRRPACIPDDYRCDSTTKFSKCDHDNWVQFDCAAGTYCDIDFFRRTHGNPCIARTTASYVPPVYTDSYVPPKVDTYVPPKVDTYVPPKVDTYVPPKVDTYTPPKNPYYHVNNDNSYGYKGQDYVVADNYDYGQQSNSYGNTGGRYLQRRGDYDNTGYTPVQTTNYGSVATTNYGSSDHSGYDAYNKSNDSYGKVGSAVYVVDDSHLGNVYNGGNTNYGNTNYGNTDYGNGSGYTSWTSGSGYNGDNTGYTSGNGYNGGNNSGYTSWSTGNGYNGGNTGYNGGNTGYNGVNNVWSSGNGYNAGNTGYSWNGYNGQGSWTGNAGNTYY